MAIEFVSRILHLLCKIILMVINLMALCLSAYGNGKQVLEISRSKTMLENLISILAAVDTVASFAGHGSLIYNAVQQEETRTHLEDGHLFMISTVGITNALLLMVITFCCWNSICRPKSAQENASSFKGMLPSHVFALAFIPYLLYALAMRNFSLQFDWTVSIVSLCFIITNTFTCMNMSALKFANKTSTGFDKQTISDSNQNLVVHITRKVIHFSFAWIPFLVVIKLLGISKAYQWQMLYGNGGLAIWSATWVFSKGAIEPFLVLLE